MSNSSKQISPPRYTGSSSFMHIPLSKDLSTLDIAFIGVPFDGAVENRPGARFGPGEIRKMSGMIRKIHHVTRINPFKLCNIADIGDVPITHIYHPEKAHTDITDFFKKIYEAGVVPLSAGGDHSITLPVFRAIVKDKPIGMIHIDAHTDTADEEMGFKFSHGTPFRRAVEEELLDPRRTIQIGIRGAQNSEESWHFSNKSGMRVVFMEEFTKLGPERVIKEIKNIVGNDLTYLSFDIDALDPVYAPGTGTPEVGGITTKEAQAILRGLSGLNLIGADLVEVAPPFDLSGNTALTAATMMYEILCILANTLIRNKKKFNI